MNNNSLEKPDPDNIKMFVGQVPKDLGENDLRTIFEEFGRVHQINVLRDKYTGSSKGESRLPSSSLALHDREAPSKRSSAPRPTAH